MVMPDKLLTAEQRYWQAVTKAHIIGKRRVRLMLEGKADSAECSHPRLYLIAELDRAYKAGLRDGQRGAA